MSLEWPRSYEMWQRSRKVLAGGVSTGLRMAMKPHPLFFARAAGAIMTDVDGHDLLDYVLGWGSIILGHCPTAVVRSVQSQVARSETFGAQHSLEYEVAEKILTHFPFAERLVYSNTGTEAVQVAVRFARAATGRMKILKFTGHYHGWSDAMLISYRPSAGSTTPQLESLGQNPRSVEDVVVAPWNDEATTRRLLSEHGGEVAAVIAEPVLGNSGVIAPHEGFLAFLRDMATRHGAMLIFDEVITGYRVGLTGAAGRFGVQPDLIVLGKAVANGYPVSVVAGRAAIIDLAAGKGVVHAGTFNGNPVVLAAAHATLTALEQPGVYTRLEQLSLMLADGFRCSLKTLGITGAVYQIGGIVQVLLGVTGAQDYGGYAQADWALYERLTVELLRRNIIVMPGGRWYLSTAHTTEYIAQTIDAFEQGLAAAVSAT